MRPLALPLLSLLVCLHASAQTPSVPATSPRLNDQRATPRSAFFGFMEACRAADYRRAASFLNLEHARYRSTDGPELSRQLKEILDRRLTGDPGRLSSAAEGDLNDGLDPDFESLGSVPSGTKSTDLLLERVSREGTQVWLISSGTVRLVPALYQAMGHSWASQNLPAWMLTEGPLDTSLWQWLGLALLVLAAFGVSALLARIFARFMLPLLRRTKTSEDEQLITAVVAPLQLLIALAIIQASMGLISPPVLLRAYLLRILAALTYLALAWLAMRIIDMIAAQFVLRMTGTEAASARSVVPLGRRTVKVAAGSIAILATLSNWGFNTNAVLAGLGVGGLAVALAAQKTIENLFGGIAVSTDQPVLIGDFCRYGDKLGFVEDIGLRSTRVRTLDRTVVTIPNATFSSMQIENFGRRDKIFFHPTLNLRRETTPQQIRELIPTLRGVLLNHPKVDPAPARVRFIGIGQWSLDIEIFAYVKTMDFDEFLVVQEEVLLDILTAIENAGTALAIPSQLSVVTRDPLTASRKQKSQELTIDLNDSDRRSVLS
ncbi:MAG: mechanosensitive ion channel family protein [Bryobacteraceae bacterium]|nr:mechanosensitive ion channel family protein [Bryobacteraceae bacterium]